MMLEFNIRNQEISRIDNFSPAEKSVEYLIAKFNFKTGDWNEAIKRAIFRNAKSKVEKDAMLEDDSCVVPWEVLVGSGEIEVSVHGVGKETITTDVATFNLDRTLSGGSATQEPSPTVYEQMVEMVKDAKEVAQSVRDDADNGKFSGIPGPPGEDGKSAYQYAVEGGYTKTEEEFKESLARAGDVITKSEHEAELLKAFVKVTTDKAPFHHITDSANYRVLDFGMEGITEQPTTSGKQIIDFTDCTNFGDGSNVPKSATLSGDTLIYEGTEKGNQLVIELNVPNFKAGEYKLYCSSAEITTTSGTYSNGATFRMGYESDRDILDVTTFVGLQYKFTIAEDVNINRCYLHLMYNWEPVVRVKLKGLVLYSSNYDATDYEPYTNGPSPNPTHPQEIKLAGVMNEETGRYEHRCCVGNKNLWDAEYARDASNWIPSTYQSSYSDIPIYVGKKDTLVTISYKDTLSTGLGIFSGVVLTENSGSINNWIYHSSNTNLISRVVLTTSKEDYIWIRCHNDGVKNGSFMQYIGNDLQIEIADAETERVKHEGSKFTLTSDRPLTMWDNLVKVDGKWYWDYKQLKLVVDGTRQWCVYGSGMDGGFRMSGLDFAGKRRDGYCNQLVVSTHTEATQTNMLWIGLNNTNLYVLRSSLYDESLEDKGLANWKAHLNEHPLEIYTYKDESELVPLLDEEQTLLNNLETYYGVTNVYNEQGCPMWLTYVTDTKLYVDQKLLEIQQAII